MGGTFAIRARLRCLLHACLGSLTRAEWGARQSMIFRPVFRNVTLYLPTIPCNPYFGVRGWLVFIVFWVFGTTPRGFLVSSQFVAKSNSIFSKPLSYQVVCFKKLLVCFSFSDEWAIDADSLLGAISNKVPCTGSSLKPLTPTPMRRKGSHPSHTSLSML